MGVPRHLTQAPLLLAALALAAAGAGHSRFLAAPAAQHPAAFHAALHEVMQAMMQAMEDTPLSGDPEQDVLALMIPHHAGAIEMARLYLQYGRDPLVRQLAEEIIVTQQVEIQSMQNRLAILRAGGAPDPAAEQALGGTRGEAPPAGPAHP
jgi:hypothetical protein